MTQQATTNAVAPVDVSRSWRIIDWVVGLALSLVVSSLTATVALGWLGENGNPVLLWLGAQTGLWMTMIATVGFVSRRHGTRNIAHDFVIRMHRRDVPVGVAVGVAVQLAVVPAVYLVLRPFVDVGEVSKPAAELVARLGEGWNVVPMIVGLVFIAPLVEELFFRGLILGSLASRYGSKVGIVGSAVIFGSFHFQPVQFPALFVFGLVLAALVWRTGRLGMAIWAHAAFNAVTVASLLLQSK